MKARCAGRQGLRIVPKVPPVRAKDRIVIVGQSGTGKSTCAKALIEREQARWPIIAVDPDDEYSVHGLARPEIVLGTLRQRVEWDGYLALPSKALDDPRLSLSVVVDEDDEEAAAQLEELARDVRNTGNLMLVLEEVGGYGEFAERTIRLLATRSRKWGVALVMVCQRMTQIPKTARSQITVVESFRQTEEDDIKALERRCGADFASRVKALPDGESILWAPNHTTP